MAGHRSDRFNEVPRRGSVIAAICFTLFLFSLAVVLVLNCRWLYYLDIRFLKLEQASGLTAADIRRNYDALIDYNQFWHRTPLIFPTLAMSREGEIHFREVKRIFDLIQVLCILTGIASLLLWFPGRRRKDRRCLITAGVLSIAIPAVLGVRVIAGWEQFFVAFHTLVFRNDYWLFDPATDPVITILPDAFFLQCAAGIVLLILAGGTVLLISGLRKRR